MKDQIDQVEARQDSMEKDISSIKNDIATLTTGQEKMNTTLVDLSSTVSDMQAEDKRNLEAKVEKAQESNRELTERLLMKENELEGKLLLKEQELQMESRLNHSNVHWIRISVGVAIALFMGVMGFIYSIQ